MGNAIAQTPIVGGNHRFTIDGSEALENHLAQVCETVLGGLRTIIPAERLEAVLLGGGYGRGEGGVLRAEGRDRPYNDLEFYVCLRGSVWLNERDYAAALHALGEELSLVATAEVEFKVCSLGHLRRSPVSMFYYDLVTGHRWVHGEETLLAGCEHHRSAHLIPLAEATRLMMNRCSGLLFARERLQREPFTSDEADFVGRNLAKAQLALGDVVLTAYRQYHSSCRERHRRLKAMNLDLPWFPEIQTHHAAGVEFKLHPERTQAPRAVLERQYSELAECGLKLWLWLESRRLNHPFSSAHEYAVSALNKCPETHCWRNPLVNWKAFGPASLRRTRALRYPRERVFHALTLLLWEQASLQRGWLERVQSELNSTAASFPDLVRAYQTLWRHVN